MTQYFRQLEQTFKAFQKSHSSQEKEDLFTQIVYHIQPILFLKFKKISIIDEDAKDLLQELLVRMYLALQTFDFSMEIPFEHYLNCMVRSMKKDFWRKKYAEDNKHQMLINEYVVEYQLNQSFKKTEEMCLKHEQFDLLQNSLNTLSQLERCVAELMILNYSPLEIADLLSAKDKVVYNSIQRCKMKMKRYLIKHQYQK
ncbi:sigma-70 family RNA polymerase sigma factor [Staphylococcus taiwanensis]|nr:sigma-70 family RNA polymerase sigma factor [Staphylococcus taiwanensis]